MQTLWTEDYLSSAEMIERIKAARNTVFTRLMNNIKLRINSWNQRRLGNAIVMNGEEYFKYYCQGCWQRYNVQHHHTVGQCTRSQAFRNFLINNHQ